MILLVIILIFELALAAFILVDEARDKRKRRKSD